jgi:hypothetical protein
MNTWISVFNSFLHRFNFPTVHIYHATIYNMSRTAYNIELLPLYQYYLNAFSIQGFDKNNNVCVLLYFLAQEMYMSRCYT